jgi:Putative lumazine-binding
MRRLLEAVQRYFDLLYDCDVSRFDRVFWPTAQLHGFREGKMTVWPAQAYKDILASRQSPKAQGAPREEQVLLVDFASSTQALVKVRVRVNSIVFADYLTYHCIDGAWLITAKGYHVERDDAVGRH